MALLGIGRKTGPTLSREQSLSARPVLHQLVTIQRNEEGLAMLSVPHKRTSTVRWICKAFKIPPYKRIELDELGTYTVELCDGMHTVAEIIAGFAQKFGLNRREAEVSMVSYLQALAKRGIISFAVRGQAAPGAAG